ncbi:MAG: phenylalanine--tRNA ligase subunit alpha, partial [Isosphaeraceae bacterium]
MNEAIQELDALEAAGLEAFRLARSAPEVEAARIDYLGQKQGKVRSAQERLKTLPNEAKKAFGQRFNAVKGA